MKIDNLNDLKSERKRLKLKLKQQEELVKSDLQWIKKELTPINAASKVLSKFLISKDKGIINHGLGIGVESLLKNFILKNSSWVTRLVIPFLAKNFTGNLMIEKKPELFSYLKSLIHKLRGSNHSKNGIYESSTAGYDFYEERN